MLSFVLAMHPMEFILRYNVIAAMIIAGIGVGLLFSAKKITRYTKKIDKVEKDNKFLQKIQAAGWLLILIGMVVMILPFEATLFGG